MKWRVGDVTITRVVELTSGSIGRHILSAATESELQKIGWIQPFVDAEWNLVLSFHALVIETPDRLMVVDTCIGNGKQRNYPKWNYMQSSFMHDFREEGFDPAGVDTVLCTHMHVDHVGWNTYQHEGKWRATFENATYLFTESEWNHWQVESQMEYGPIIEDSVQPIFDLGLAQLVQQDHTVSDGVSLVPTPGHTPGHVSVKIQSGGEQAVITGDIFHHPCQFVHPRWEVTADFNHKRAQDTRLKFLKDFADTPTLIIGTHFAGPTAGRIVSDGDVYRLDY